MKIVCDKKLLTAAVTNVCRAVSAKSTIPVLEGVHIIANGNQVTLSGYDLEMGIKTTIDATVYKAGTVVLNAKLFSEIVRKMPMDEISIVVDNKNVAVISSGITQFSISAQDSSEYPEMPVLDNSDYIYVAAGELKSMIDQTLFAVSVNDSKPVHMGSLIECDNGYITMVSVDGVRLALKRSKINYNGKKSFVVPGKTLSEISKLINDSDKIVKISASNKHVVFEIEGYTVISRLLEGDFLDYKTAIPQTNTTEVVVLVKDLIESIERTSLVIFDKLKAPIKLVLEEDVIKFYCQSPTGNSYDELACKINGANFEIGFNSKIMLDALKVINDEKVKLLFNGALSPMKIVPVDGDEFIFLILPVRLKNDDKAED